MTEREKCKCGMNVYTAGLCWRHWQGMTRAEKEAHLARRNKR